MIGKIFGYFLSNLVTFEQTLSVGVLMIWYLGPSPQRDRIVFRALNQDHIQNFCSRGKEVCSGGDLNVLKKIVRIFVFYDSKNIQGGGGGGRTRYPAPDTALSDTLKWDSALIFFSFFFFSFERWYLFLVRIPITKMYATFLTLFPRELGLALEAEKHKEGTRFSFPSIHSTKFDSSTKLY